VTWRAPFTSPYQGDLDLEGLQVGSGGVDADVDVLERPLARGSMRNKHSKRNRTNPHALPTWWIRIQQREWGGGHVEEDEDEKEATKEEEEEEEEEEEDIST